VAVLTEEALLLFVVAVALVLLVLGVLELIWPTRRRQPARRAQARAAMFQATPTDEPPVVPRPQSIGRPRPYDAVTPVRSGAVLFPPPPRYVAPPSESDAPSELTVPHPIGLVRPGRPLDAEPLAPPVRDDPPPAVESAASPPAELVRPDRPLDVEPSVPSIDDPPPLPRENASAPSIDVDEPVSRVDELSEVPALDERLEPPAIDEPRPPEPEELRPPVAEGAAFAQPEEPVALEPEPALEPAVDPAPPPAESTVPPEITVSADPAVPAEATAPPEPVAPSETIAPAPTAAELPGPARQRRRSKISPHARPHNVLRGPKTSNDAGSTAPAANAGADRGDDAPPARPWSIAPEGGSDARPRRDSPLVETCFALYQEKRFSEVVSIGERTLAKLPVESPATPSHETAALWSVVGLAKQGLGDDDGARAALESALDVAPDGERATYRRHLATLALEAAQSRLARAGGHDTGDRVATTRTAIAWTERGLAAVPFDPALSDARERAYEALWEGYEQASTTLLQRQEFRVARQLLREALDDPALPGARAAGFRGLLSGTFSGEIGQLTAQAILGMQEGRESEALESLERAEELLATIPAEALPSSRREEVDQRLWWGYAELGSRRLEAGEYEDALDPLVHALRFESIGPERQGETRAAVVRALEGIAALRAMSVRRLIDAGLRDEAVQTAEQLRTLVNGCRDLGFSDNELMAATSRVRRLWEELGMDDPT
jgi:tetratricopeptide (TPR) repeat protein